jgi:hypothetical protein
MTRPIVVPPTALLSLFLAWIGLLSGAFVLGMRIAG